MGYIKYVGLWEDDHRHGDGEMYIAGPDGTEYVFEGSFENGMRQGHGTMKQDGGGEYFIYNGEWADDAIKATPSNCAWSHLGDNIYYGALTPEGDRHGYGILYSKDAMDDDVFKNAFLAETPEARKYKPQNLTDKSSDLEKHRFKLYEGQWENNVPHGEGAQFFEVTTGTKKKEKKELTTYHGQFQNGKRHGRGIWDGLDSAGKRWKYRPIPAPATAHNWSNDQMHGIAIVEDQETVHENVVYTQGACQMPFTQEGPPMTGFREGSVLAGVAGKMKKGKLLSSAGDKIRQDDGRQKE